MNKITFTEITKFICNYLHLNYEETKSQINSDYFRVQKDYNNITENSFVYNMLKKYPNMYDHYNDIEYVIASIFFYKVSSSSSINLLKNLMNNKKNKTVDCFNEKQLDFFKNIKYIVDLGAGIGITTLFLSKIFPNAIIYYTNLKSKQSQCAEKMFDNYNCNNIIILENCNNINQCDLLLSLNYFEHFYEPFKEINNVFDKLSPKFILDSTDFQHCFIGHFENYKINNEIVYYKKCSQIYKDFLNKNNYYKHNIHMWNDIPKVYYKKDYFDETI